MTRLLEDVTVVDLTRALAGPVCTALLADFGADVIKVETFPAGDSARGWPPFDGDESLYFAPINRNKRSLALNLRTQDGHDTLLTLLGRADVLVENFRPGVLERMGLAPDMLRERFPGLVVASVSGFGPVGPEATTGGLDQIAQGLSGLMSVTGEPGVPTRVGVPIVDNLAGIVAAFGITAALQARSRTGRACHVQTSLLESALSVMCFQAQRFLSLGEVPTGQGNSHPTICPYGGYPTADEHVNIAVGTEAQWRELCRVLGAPDLPGKPEYRNGRTRLEHRDALNAELCQLLNTRPSAEWIRLIRRAGIPCGPVHSMSGVFADPQVQALEMVRSVNTSDGTAMPLLRGPLWVDGIATDVHRAPPRFGEHSREILNELGFSGDEVSDLLDAGVIHQETAE